VPLALSHRQIFAHVPVRLIVDDPDFFIVRRLQPEIHFTASDLESPDDGRLANLSAKLEASGLRCTVHAPFLDLNPGALDEGVRRLSLSRYRALLDAASLLKPVAIVFHPGYDHWRYDGNPRPWLDASLRTWPDVLEKASSACPEALLLIENIFERDPHSLAALLSEIDHPRFRFCFDTGHFLLFGQTPLDNWMGELGGRLAEIHLHDNRGSRDEHLPPGLGKFPFDDLFSLVDKLGISNDVLVTFEAHTREHLDQSLLFAERHLIGGSCGNSTGSGSRINMRRSL
jgi:sugar phosphate isomerase/epimerase